MTIAATRADPPLNDGQRAVAVAFAAWLERPADGTPFLLSGHAGSGKTFLAMRLLAMVEAAGLCWTVVAPTHKAVGVLRQHLALAGLHPTWYPSTLHRLLRLKLRRQRERECCEETLQTARALEHLGLVLVDEASMVDAALLEITLRCAHSFGTRLVFVGDPAQLPPVGEAAGPVFDLQRVRRGSLREVVRHQGPVLRLASGLRSGALPCLAPPPFGPVRHPQGTVRSLTRGAWLEAAQTALQRSASEGDPDQVRLLCHTNRTLEQLVPIARRALHGPMADQLPVLPGEVLITRAAVMAPACSAGLAAAEEPDLVLGSNRELLVRDVRCAALDLAELGGGPEAARAPRRHGTEGEGAEGLPLIDTLIVSVETEENQLELRLLPPPGSLARQLLDGVLGDLRRRARAAEGRSGRALWRQYFVVRDAFAWLGPAAVLTVHRSQGSSFGEVFVAADVFQPADARLRRQLAYVAVSRAREGVTLMAGARGSAGAWERWLQAEAVPAEAGEAAGGAQPAHRPLGTAVREPAAGAADAPEARG